MTDHTPLPAWAHAVADNVAAYALEHRSRKEVVIWHPCGPDHPNAQATTARYDARGWTVHLAPVCMVSPKFELAVLDD